MGEEDTTSGGARESDPVGLERDHARLVSELEQLRQEKSRLERDLECMAAERARVQDELLHPHRMEAAGTLAAGLAHDMNNVLAAIMNFCEVLLDQPHASQVRNDLEQIVAQAERGAGLTRGLLAFSRKGQYRKQVCELDRLIRGALPLLAHTLPKSIEIRTQLGTGSARIDGDPVQLAQALVNFGLNAADAMGGMGTFEIVSELVEVDTAQALDLDVVPGTFARLRITDTGRGMDEMTRRRVFEPFFTTKPIGKGTGLGLALVWGVVKGHAGAIAVQSEIDRGTTFTLHLPVTELALSVAKDQVQRRPHAADATILVVDDEPAVRAGTTRILERTGYKVLGASDGAEALRVLDLHGTSIGLVILDMAMPVMGGAECFRQIRLRSVVPVLIATGYALDEEVQSLVARGAALIEKPYSSAGLVVEVMRLLEQSAPERRHL